MFFYQSWLDKKAHSMAGSGRLFHVLRRHNSGFHAVFRGGDRYDLLAAILAILFDENSSHIYACYIHIGHHESNAVREAAALMGPIRPPSRPGSFEPGDS